MSRLLLLLPTATYRARDFLDAAAALGAEVVVASERRQALAGVMGERVLRVNLRRPEAAARAIVALAGRMPLDAVVAVDDQAVLVAALAAERLGLARNPPEAVAAARDKAATRRAFAAAGLPQPEYRIAGPRADVALLAAEVGSPCVVKPVSLSASRGVIRAGDPPAAAAAAARIREILREAGEDPDGPLLVERYLPGVEVAVEGLLRGGALEVLAVFDKPDPLEGPYFEETIYVTPSRLPAEALETITRLTAAAASALGLGRGADPRRAQDRRHASVAARARCALDRRALLAVFALRAGREPRGADPPPRPRASARRAGPRGGRLRGDDAADSGAGVLEEVRGQDEALAVPGVTGLEISIARGRPVRPLPEGDRYLGFLFARAETPDEVEQALRTANGRLEIVIGEPSDG